MRIFAILATVCLAPMQVAGPVSACALLETGPCDIATPPPFDLLAPYKARCEGVFAIEELAISAAAEGGWLLNPRAMSCDDQPLCVDCPPIWARPIPGCQALDCWHRKVLAGARPAE